MRNHRQGIIRGAACAIALLAALPGAGCAADGGREAVAPADAPPPPVEVEGLEVAGPTLVDARVPAEPPAEAEKAAMEAAVDPNSMWREDGRPVWWQSEPKVESVRMVVTAEALADDVVAARRAAIDAGREALRRAVGESPRDERIEAIQVRPLPGAPSSSGRCVGYVRISARAPGAPRSP